jgi:AsmA protein
MMRRPIVILLAAVAALIVAVIVAVSLFDVNKFRPRIQAELQAKLGRPVTLGELHLRLLPLSLRVDGLTVGQSPGWASPRPLATAKEVYASASLMSLVRGRPDIKALTLEEPQVELIRNQQGIWNFSSARANEPSRSSPGGGATPPAAKSSPVPPAESGQGSGFTLNRLKITDGQIAVTDERAKTPRTVYNHIDLTVSGLAPGKAFDFDLAAHVPGPGKERLALTGTAGPFGGPEALTVPITGHLSLEEVSLAGLNSVAAGAIPPNTDGTLSGDGEISSQDENLASKGNLKLANAVIRGGKINYPAVVQYDLTMNRKTDQMQLRSGSIKLGPTEVSVSGAINSAVKPAALNLRITTANASIPELTRLASAFGSNSSSSTSDQVKGSISADLMVTGTASAPQVKGNISAPSVQAQNVALSNVHTTCNMSNGVIVLSPLTASIFGGQESGTVSLDTRPAHPLCSVNARFSGVDTNALLSALSSVKDTLYGSLAADSNLSFGLGSNVDIAKTLNGVLNFNVTNGRLKNINILNELSRVGKFVGGAPAAGGAGTALQKLSGALNIKDGVATTNNLIATMNEGSLSAAGSLNLVNQGLNLHMTAVLSKGISSAVGGSSIGGFLNTALANNQGELVLPVLVTGTTDHPVFAPDAAAIAKMKLNHLLPTTGDPSKLSVGSVLGGILGQQPGQQKNQKQAIPLDSLFKQLGKKKPH